MRLAASRQQAFRLAFEQGDTLAQRRREIQLAVHGAVGDVGDARRDADQIGHLVEHLVLDRGQFHVGDQQRFAPASRRAEPPHLPPAASDVVRACRIAVESDVGGVVRRQPIDRCAEFAAISSAGLPAPIRVRTWEGIAFFYRYADGK